MKLTDYTRRILAARRERRKLLGEGYVYQDMSTMDGSWNDVITDVKIAVHRRGVYIKRENPDVTS